MAQIRSKSPPPPPPPPRVEAEEVLPEAKSDTHHDALVQTRDAEMKAGRAALEKVPTAREEEHAAGKAALKSHHTRAKAAEKAAEKTDEKIDKDE